MKIGFRGCTSCDFTTLQALYNSGGPSTSDYRKPKMKLLMGD